MPKSTPFGCLPLLQVLPSGKDWKVRLNAFKTQVCFNDVIHGLIIFCSNHLLLNFGNCSMEQNPQDVPSALTMQSGYPVLPWKEYNCQY